MIEFFLSDGTSAGAVMCGGQPADLSVVSTGVWQKPPDAKWVFQPKVTGRLHHASVAMPPWPPLEVPVKGWLLGPHDVKAGDTILFDRFEVDICGD